MWISFPLFLAGLLIYLFVQGLLEAKIPTYSGYQRQPSPPHQTDPDKDPESEA
jgi:hypothetical protein